MWPRADRRKPVGASGPWCDYSVVDYKTPDLAATCVRSIELYEPTATVTLIDAAADGLSYAGAAHIGVNGGHAPVVCICNADTEMLGPQTQVQRIFDRHDRVAIVGPLQVDLNGLVRHAGIVGSNAEPRHRFWETPYDTVQVECEGELACVTVSGSVFYCRRDVWDALGGFLPTPHYYEETWLCYFARHRGYRVLYTGGAKWIHHWNSSPLDTDDKMNRWMESRALFREACAREGILSDVT